MQQQLSFPQRVPNFSGVKLLKNMPQFMPSKLNCDTLAHATILSGIASTILFANCEQIGPRLYDITTNDILNNGPIGDMDLIGPKKFNYAMSKKTLNMWIHAHEIATTVYPISRLMTVTQFSSQIFRHKLWHVWVAKELLDPEWRPGSKVHRGPTYFNHRLLSSYASSMLNKNAIVSDTG